MLASDILQNHIMEVDPNDFIMKDIFASNQNNTQRTFLSQKRGKKRTKRMGTRKRYNNLNRVE